MASVTQRATSLTWRPAMLESTPHFPIDMSPISELELPELPDWLKMKRSSCVPVGPRCLLCPGAGVLQAPTPFCSDGQSSRSTQV